MSFDLSIGRQNEGRVSLLDEHNIAGRQPPSLRELCVIKVLQNCFNCQFALDSSSIQRLSILKDMQGNPLQKIALEAPDRRSTIIFYLFEVAITHGQWIESAVETAKLAVCSENAEIRCNGLILFEKLVNKGHALFEAEVAVRQANRKDVYCEDLLHELVKQGRGFPAAISQATRSIRCPDFSYIVKGARLFKTLIEKDRGFFEANQVALEVIASGQHTSHVKELLYELIKLGKAFPEALTVATIALDSELPSTVSAGLYLMSLLCGQGQNFPEATQAATRIFPYEYDYRERHALDLFIKLFEKKQGFSEAYQAATLAVNSNDENKRIHGLELFCELVKHDQFFLKATTIASQVYCDEDWIIRKHALKLFVELFKKDQGFSEAITVATQSIDCIRNKFDPSNINRDSIDLFLALFDKDQGFKEAIALATQRINHENTEVRMRATLLFMALFTKRQGFSEAIALATQAARDTNLVTACVGLKLFGELVKQGQGFNEAAVAITEVHEDNYNAIYESLLLALAEKGQGFENVIKCMTNRFRNEPFPIFTAFVRNGQRFAEALQLAMQAIHDESAKWCGLDLLAELVKKGQAFPEATKAAIEAITNKTTANAGINIFLELIKQGQAIQETIELAVHLIENRDENKYMILSKRATGVNLLKELVEQGQAYPIAIKVAIEEITHGTFNTSIRTQEGRKLLRNIIKNADAVPGTRETLQSKFLRMGLSDDLTLWMKD